ncbi:transglutaminase-like protein [Leptospira fainei serovar Hurstbridge str. BUT 6]|uniref:Transglutaminase-like protein n=1 Tax=Leptospira fainei serovar Hurstbridge str. BUT 6 TaxID=1193011 RepID=S3VWT8_9LEPT|nr:transglutaminase domain-containing protein [Leptospira fainei]EPG72587.1 transglutaminase-like protein [Leptospira fainei serovar Hurstbridge str. BUT 6]
MIGRFASAILLVYLFLFLNAGSAVGGSSARRTSIMGISSGEPVLKRFPQRFKITRKLRLASGLPSNLSGSGFKIEILIPIPQDDESREVSGIKYNTGDIVISPDSQQKFLYITSGNSAPEVEITHLVKSYRTDWDPDFFDAEVKYDPTSDLVMRYTGKHEQIDPNHPNIRSLVSAAAKKTSRPFDFANESIKEIQKKLIWKNTGKYATISQTFANGGGDCGALSRVLQSMLRSQGIPTRFVSGGILKNGKDWDWHVWTEFYIPEKGWVPADPAMFESVPMVGFMDKNHIAFNRGEKEEVFLPDGRKMAVNSGLQNYLYYYSSYDGPAIRYDMDVRVEVLDEAPEDSYYNSDSFLNRIRNSFLERINGVRLESGLPLLTKSDKLEKAAQDLAIGMVSGDEKDYNTSLKDQGYSAKGLLLDAWIVGDIGSDAVSTNTDRLVKDPSFAKTGFAKDMGVGVGYRLGRFYFYVILGTE